MSENDNASARHFAAQAGNLDSMKLEIARQYAPRAWRSGFSGLIQRVRGGEGLTEAVNSDSLRCPPRLRSLLQESLQSSDPTKLIIEMMQLRNRVNRHWASISSSLTYPIAITLATLIVSAAIAFQLAGEGYGSFAKMMGELGLRTTDGVVPLLQDQANVFVGICAMIVFVIGVAFTLVLVGSKWSVLAVISGLPLFGRPYRWLALSELLGRIDLFVRQGRSLTESIRAVERGYRHDGLSRVVEAVGCRVESGLPFGQALQLSILSDGLCRPALSLLDQRSNVPAARIREVSEVLMSMASRRCRLLAATMPIVMLLLAGSIIWNTMQCYMIVFMALISLINALA